MTWQRTLVGCSILEYILILMGFLDMNLEELEAYVEGYKDARNAFLDKFEECYFNVKTD